MHGQLINNVGITKEVKIGFSWTTFFFGFFPALFRGDLKWAVIMLIASIAAGIITFGVGAWIPGIIFSFIYNKLYIRELLEKGYRPANDTTQVELENRGIISARATIAS